MGEKQADIGLIGLAVMGQNLVLNLNDHGYRVVVFNRTLSKVDEFLRGPAKNSPIIGAYTLKEFINALKKPRKIMIMVKAGRAVDDVIEEFLPYLEAGDIIIDGGNSHYPDSERRMRELNAKGILFLGTGISGGEEGARHGPSIMPGGNIEAWNIVKPMFQSIAAKATEDGIPCCDWVGEGGAGHYVKMIHNGIEYGDMQLICEAYQLLKDLLGCKPPQLQGIFNQWNQGPLHSYLIEITSTIFGFKDKDGSYLVDHILDVAGQKGTGKWTAISALDLGIPVTLIAESVFARCLSALKEERRNMSKAYPPSQHSFSGDRSGFINDLEQALYASKIISYTQGFMLMRAAAAEMKWKLNFGSIALMWRAGCIIRSRFLNDIKKAYDKNPQLENLLFDDFFKKAIMHAKESWRRVVIKATEAAVPNPCLATALAFFDGLCSERLPANLLQAQRDFFGAHTYERVDTARGTFFHTEWIK